MLADSRIEYKKTYHIAHIKALKDCRECPHYLTVLYPNGVRRCKECNFMEEDGKGELYWSLALPKVEYYPEELR